MAHIGTFTEQNNSYSGTVRTLTLNVKIKIVPNGKEKGNAPDYRILVDNFEIGAAWKKVSKADRPYLSVTLDDPSFPSHHLRQPGRSRSRCLQPDLVAKQGRLNVARPARLRRDVSGVCQIFYAVHAGTHSMWRQPVLALLTTAECVAQISISCSDLATFLRVRFLGSAASG
jgi:uncharacterized protein (DUF736 family)